ncbi:hypothetical protein B0I33_114135 [Prauserella shujinwangii]|uniref:Uncharacterized protein n=1 Tax=Prauserella shujinwangii TaxID=1453103 RepID=A0A2T0LLB0_9PSEU|nr:hypothetical protein [Prauserella shujinwangii]PRX43674.1 hypothetical protein B0I33_114135 [Prauserella shujinwangii]
MSEENRPRPRDQQEYVDEVAEREQGRAAPVENDAGVLDEPEAQPGRSAVSRRTKEARATPKTDEEVGSTEHAGTRRPR